MGGGHHSIWLSLPGIQVEVVSLRGTPLLGLRQKSREATMSARTRLMTRIVRRPRSLQDYRIGLHGLGDATILPGKKLGDVRRVIGYWPGSP